MVLLMAITKGGELPIARFHSFRCKCARQEIAIVVTMIFPPFAAVMGPVEIAVATIVAIVK